ncbi:MAG: DinB family protein [Gemmatimonadota bacterium]
MRTIADPAVLADLTARLERLTSEQARVWGSITSHQMAVHLADTHEAVLQRRAFTIPPRRPSRVVKVIALNLPLPWPRGIRSGADPGSKELAPGTFEADRQLVIATLVEVAGASAGALVTHHPIFGPMTRANWHRWAFLHVDHHLRQFAL